MLAGLVGSTDSHTSLSTTEENNFFGKVVLLEPSADPIRFATCTWPAPIGATDPTTGSSATGVGPSRTSPTTTWTRRLPGLESQPLRSRSALERGRLTYWFAETAFSLTAEYNEAQVDSPETGDPQFRGYYVTGSWVITGEHRPYDRKVGYARRVLPTGRWVPWS